MLKSSSDTVKNY